MKPITHDLKRQFIVRHNHELRTLLTSTGRLLPEVYDRMSFTHLEDEVVASIRAFCGTTEFSVTEVAVLPRVTDHNGAGDDLARVLLSPVSGSNFGASNLICLPIHQPLAEKARVDEAPAGQNQKIRPELSKLSEHELGVRRSFFGWPGIDVCQARMTTDGQGNTWIEQYPGGLLAKATAA